MRKRNLGAMRHKIQLKTVVRTPDGSGGFSRDDAFSPDLIDAKVETISAGEKVAYDKLDERVSHRILIRHRDLEQGSTIRWIDGATNRDLYVVAKKDPRLDRPGEWLELVCREGGNL